MSPVVSSAVSGVRYVLPPLLPLGLFRFILITAKQNKSDERVRTRFTTRYVDDIVFCSNPLAAPLTEYDSLQRYWLLTL